MIFTRQGVPAELELEGQWTLTRLHYDQDHNRTVVTFNVPASHVHLHTPSTASAKLYVKAKARYARLSEITGSPPPTDPLAEVVAASDDLGLYDLTPDEIELCLDGLSAWRAGFEFEFGGGYWADAEALEAKLQAVLMDKLDATIDDMTEDDT